MGSTEQGESHARCDARRVTSSAAARALEPSRRIRALASPALVRTLDRCSLCPARPLRSAAGPPLSLAALCAWRLRLSMRSCECSRAPSAAPLVALSPVRSLSITNRSSAEAWRCLLLGSHSHSLARWLSPPRSRDPAAALASRCGRCRRTSTGRPRTQGTTAHAGPPSSCSGFSSSASLCLLQSCCSSDSGKAPRAQEEGSSSESR